MHREALEWVHENAPLDARTVLDIGGRDVNGSPKGLFSGPEVYRVLDIEPGPGVHLVADAATWTPDREYDVVVCCEVFEHAARWPEIITTALKACKPGGLFVATMAGPGRELHSGIDGGPNLYVGETYANIDPDQLFDALLDAGWENIRTSQLGSDVRCVATRAKAHSLVPSSSMNGSV
jgi:SAM-dependent methyltransferase